ncbi:MAG: hypothetical protein IPP48_17235 [Chitinophagaceae bacterium]|nr:hypothetical protein [Chitinophagaceae bacterium]
MFHACFFCLLLLKTTFAQDSTVLIGSKSITLSEVVINSKLNVASFIDKIKSDTSFYKSFKNLRILNFSAINDIRMNDKEGNAKASLFSKTNQLVKNGCRKMQTTEEKITGNFYDESNNYNYYTAQLYGSLFFTKDSVCGETNIVTGTEFNTEGKKGMEKHKAQLKMLFFNPGKKINGLPFMSNKTAIYDDDMAEYYDMQIDAELYRNTSCFVFRQKVKPDSKGKVVVDEMTTWFDDQTFEIKGRNYSLSYDAGVYDFDVQMQVEISKFGQYQVPTLIRYTGNWKAIFKKRERGIFTATLYNFK